MASTVVTSNREPVEWFGRVWADPLLAESAIDRLQSTAWEPVLDGECCPAADKTRPRRRNHQPSTPPATPHFPAPDPAAIISPPTPTDARTRSHAIGGRVVPYCWRNRIRSQPTITRGLGRMLKEGCRRVITQCCPPIFR